MQGQNANAIVYRATQQADDAAGGAVHSAYYVNVTDLRVRLFQRLPSLEMRMQGLSSDKFFDCFLQPATTDVVANDMLIPQDGKFAHFRFLVTAVQHPSLEEPPSPMAHLRLQLERWDDGKMVNLI